MKSHESSSSRQIDEKPERKKQELNRDREPGKSILPFSRVQRIIKADKDLPMIAKDATFLISLATEEFIKRLTGASQRLAEREKRATVQQKDVANVARRAEEFLFLDEILAHSRTEPTTKRKPKALQAGNDQGESTSGPTMLDKFVGQRQTEVDESRDVIMNDDGTMVAG